MGILDKLKQHKDDTDGAAGAVKDKAASGLDQAGQTADEKTGGKYTGQIDEGIDKTKQTIGEGTPDPVQPQPQPQQQPPAQPEQPAGASPTDDTQEQPPTA